MVDADDVDLLLLAGDLTRRDAPAEARVLAEELAGLPVPAIAVLGNHDHHHGAQREIAAILESAGVTVLEGACAVVQVCDLLVGVAGVKGFAGVCATEFGEPEMKAFAASARLAGEPAALWPFLGSYLLAEAVDAGGAALALHGHAPRGQRRVAMTPGGVPVHNVARPVIRQPFATIQVTTGGARRWDSSSTTSLPRS